MGGAAESAGVGGGAVAGDGLAAAVPGRLDCPVKGATAAPLEVEARVQPRPERPLLRLFSPQTLPPLRTT